MRSTFDPAPRRPTTRGERLGAALFALLLTGLLAAELLQGYSPRKLSVLFIIAFWAPLLVVHELGHALTARLLGWHVHEIVIGFGPELARFSVGGTRVTLRLVPMEGYVVPSPDRLEGARGKSALVYFGGPGAEVLCALLALAWLGPETMFTRTEAIPVIAVQSFALAAVIGVLMTLIPHAGGGGASDGLGILLSFRLSDNDFAYRMAGPAMDEAQRRIEADNPEGALEHIDAEIAHDPNNPFLPIMRVRCVAATGDRETALAELERMREQPHHSDLVEGERLHAAARVVLEAGDRELLADAEGACRAALERMGGSPDVQVTLGAILIEQARYREAEEILQTVFKRTRDPWQEDHCMAYLALTALALGREADAELFRQAFEARSHNRRLRKQLSTNWIA